MSLQKSKFERRILPRWRSSQNAAANPDFLSLKASKSRFQTDISVSPLAQKTADFDSQPSIGTAAELMAVARLENREVEAALAARFLITKSEQVPHSALSLAKRILTGDAELIATELDPNCQVRHIRTQLRLQPRNAMLWSDLSRHYASIGDRERALRSMQTALSLQPDHRWLLRTAARFMVHQEDPVAAHKLLSTHPRTRHDPWLVAAELACAQAAGRVPRFWSQARDMLRFEHFSPAHISELATAIAMFDLENGKRKNARKLVEKALIAPTENTLAQVFWAKEDKHLPDGFRLVDLVQKTHAAYEAEYGLRMNEGDLLAAKKSVLNWSDDEPFAARPCAELAYIATLFDDYESTLKMANKAKQLDGHLDIGLELNAIFAQLSSGNFSKPNEPTKIRERLMQIIEEVRMESFHAFANLGLWEFRHGSADVGVALYQKAIEVALRLKGHEPAAMASIFAAREAILAQHESTATFLMQAHDLAPKAKNKSVDFYLRKVDALVKAPDQRSALLNPASAPEFLVIEKKVPKVIKIEHSSKGAVIWVKH